MSTPAQSNVRLITRERLSDAFRDAILRAMDRAAKENLNGPAGVQVMGALDSDLPALFRVIDAHAETVAKRYGYIVDETDSYNPDATGLEFRAGQEVVVNRHAAGLDDQRGEVTAITVKGVWVRLARSETLLRFHPSCVRPA